MSDTAEPDIIARREFPGMETERALVLEWLETWSAYQDWQSHASNDVMPAELQNSSEAGEILRNSLAAHDERLADLDLEAARDRGTLPETELATYRETHLRWTRENELLSLRGDHGHEVDRER